MIISRRLVAPVVGLAAVAGMLIPAAAGARGNPGNGGGGGGRPPTAGTETVGNNLSNPVVFAEGYGITGLSSATPTTGEPWQQAWTGLRIPSPTNPTLNGPTYNLNGTPYYLQGDELSSWQAGWVDGQGSTTPWSSNVKWGDNVIGTLLPSSGTTTAWTTTATIHLEVGLTSPSTLAALGQGGLAYFPTTALYGTGSTEVFGTTGGASSADDQHPGVYSDAAYLTIQSLSGAGGSVTGTVHNLATWNRTVEGPSSNALTPEVNAGGSVDYSYNWFTGRDGLAPGWYRLTFGIVTGSASPTGTPATTGKVAIDGIVGPSPEEGGTGQTVSCGQPVQVTGDSGTVTLPMTCGSNTYGPYSSVDVQLVAGSTSGAGGGTRGNPGNGGGSGGRPPTSGTETVGNNLSNPVVFADGYGITGLSSDTATTGEPWQQAWTGLRIPSPANPTLDAADAYLLNGTTYYRQGTELSSWQASWIDGHDSGSPWSANVKWGDNVIGTLLPSSGGNTAWTTTATIHLEVGLTSPSTLAALGQGGLAYFPTTALYGTGSTEVFGTTGGASSADDQHPGVYSDAAYLTIQSLSGPGGTVLSTVHTLATWNRTVEGPSSNALTPEVNASGSVDYSYNWFTGRDGLAPGWYRLTFGIVTGSASPTGTPATTGKVAIDGIVGPSPEEGGTGQTVSCGQPVQVTGDSGTVTLPMTCGSNTYGPYSSVDVQLIAGGTTGGGGGGSGSGSGGGGGGSGRPGPH